ncbi:hypothetical protein [Candidatus Hecatella orcuttiae]|uniref:hypothetical protein n=1 Tax=Candidatus Hecatella orcuttiae TaxID=1935119 RepID=UPI0028682889|nr:hypothetical protein [Candidatus Hecatella orcuttiae]
MVLEDFLFPGEAVSYKSLSKVKYLGDKFDFYITNQRLILFQGGKKDRLFAERFRDIGSLRYSERGRLLKEASITLENREKYQMEISGKASDMRVIWIALQKKWQELQKTPSTAEAEKAKCKFCGALMNAGSLVCPTCRKIQK